jgi:hypothetical protein
MTNRVYTTANGKAIDFGALQLRNEETKAVGNMGVNARGDKIEKNRVVETRSRMVQGQHKRQSKMIDTPPYSSIAEYKRVQANKPPEEIKKTKPIMPSPLTLNIDATMPVEDLTVVSVEDQMAAGDLTTADVQTVEEFEPDVAVTSEDIETLTGLAAALAKKRN